MTNTRYSLTLAMPFILLVVALPPRTQGQTGEYTQQVNLAHGYMQERRYQDALDAFRKAYDLFPNPKVLADMGIAFLDMGMATEAQNVWEQALTQGGELSISLQHEHGVGFCLGALSISTDELKWSSSQEKENFRIKPSELQKVGLYKTTRPPDTQGSLTSFMMQLQNKNWRFVYLLYGPNRQYEMTGPIVRSVVYSGSDLSQAEKATDLIVRVLYTLSSPQPERKKVNKPDLKNLRPSGTFTTFTGRWYRLSHPENWNVNGDENFAVSVAPHEGRIGEFSIAYGASIVRWVPPSKERMPLGDAVSHLLQRLDPTTRLIGQQDDIRINGIAAKSLHLLSQSPYRGEGGRAEQEHDWVIVLPSDDLTFLYLWLVAPEVDFPELRPTFEKMLQSFQFGAETANPAGRENAPAASIPSLELREGQTPEEVEKVLGKPEDVITVKETIVYAYPTVRVFFEKGKLVNVEERKK